MTDKSPIDLDRALDARVGAITTQLPEEFVRPTNNWYLKSEE